MPSRSEEKIKRSALRRSLLNAITVAVISIVVFYVALLLLKFSQTTINSLIWTLIYGVIFIEIIGLVIYLYFSSKVSHEEAGPLRDLFRIITYIILIIIILAELQVNLYGLLVSAGFLGIVLGLAAQSTIANFIAGIYLLSSDAFETGDHVIIHTWQYNLQPATYPHDRFVPGFTGIIKSIGILYTELTNEEHIPVYVPNNIVAQAMVINYKRAKDHMSRIQFDIDIRIKFTTVEEIVKAVMKKNKISAYRIDIEYLINNLYVITIHVKIDDEEKPKLKTEVYTALIKQLNKEHQMLEGRKPSKYSKNPDRFVHSVDTFS